MGIVTSMISAVSILGNLRCQGCQHQQLEGNNKYGTRTAQAAEWPEEFDKLVADVIAQQVLLDEAEDSIEAFPLGVVAELPVPRPIPGRLAQVSHKKRRRLVPPEPIGEAAADLGEAPPPPLAEEEPGEPVTELSPTGASGALARTRYGHLKNAGLIGDRASAPAWGKTPGTAGTNSRWSGW